MIFENSCDHGAIWKSVATRADDLTVVPKSFKLSAIRPMESAMTLQFAIMELAFKPGAIRQALSALAFD